MQHSICITSRRDEFKTKLHTWELVGASGCTHQVEGLRENEENPDQASEEFWNRSWGGFADRDGLGDLDRDLKIADQARGSPMRGSGTKLHPFLSKVYINFPALRGNAWKGWTTLTRRQSFGLLGPNPKYANLFFRAPPTPT